MSGKSLEKVSGIKLLIERRNKSLKNLLILKLILRTKNFRLRFHYFYLFSSNFGIVFLIDKHNLRRKKNL